MEPLHHALPVHPQALGNIGFSLRNMDVKTCIEIRGQASAAGNSFIAQGEGSMKAKESAKLVAWGLPATAEKRFIFFDTPVSNFGAVSIRNLIAKATAQAGEARGVCNAKQAARHCARA